MKARDIKEPIGFIFFLGVVIAVVYGFYGFLIYCAVKIIKAAWGN